jgi:hypothetical protein
MHKHQLTNKTADINDANISLYMKVYPRFPDWPAVVRTANGTALCH